MSMSMSMRMGMGMGSFRCCLMAVLGGLVGRYQHRDFGRIGWCSGSQCLSGFGFKHRMQARRQHPDLFGQVAYGPGQHQQFLFFHDVDFFV